MFELLGVIIAVSFMIHVIYHYYCLYDIEQTKIAFQEELKKFEIVGTERSKITKEQLVLFIAWANEDLPALISALMLSDFGMQKLQEDAKISDQEYIKSFETIISDVQNVIGHKAKEIIDIISEHEINSLKKLME